MKILQIAYYYPPMGGAGVQRALKFSKYLPQHGVTPIVIACDDPYYVRDETLLREVPEGLEVHRIKFSPWLARIAAQIRTSNSRSSTKTSTKPLGISTKVRTALRNAVLRNVRTLQMPDDAAPWAREALRKARQVIHDHAARGEPIELIMSSSPPVSTHVLGERLAREFGLPWVIDFRDLWTDNPNYDLPTWRHAWDWRTEQRWLTRATGVVTVTPSLREMLASRLRPEAAVAFIPNGYDEADFTELPQPVHDPEFFTIVHTGTFYGKQNPDVLLEGIAHYLKNLPSNAKTNTRPLRFRLIGNMGSRFFNTLQSFENRFPGVVQTIPYVPHAQALAELASADALLLVAGGERGTLTGKIFEYLRIGKPILTLCNPEGDAAALIRRHANGIIIKSDDADGLADALGALVSGQLNNRLPNDEQLQPANIFERCELAGQLAAFLHECQSRHLNTNQNKNR
ncbi:MAG: glycosyltransferase family 4 protein [Comamonadaceae bacterium]|jgi:glycosyltransferase involved in cell wall biosynthesis|nr:glycosyltransferase family 4 protein [Comamonadaceae bacterium]